MSSADTLRKLTSRTNGRSDRFSPTRIQSQMQGLRDTNSFVAKSGVPEELQNLASSIIASNALTNQKSEIFINSFLQLVSQFGEQEVLNLQTAIKVDPRTGGIEQNVFRQNRRNDHH